MSALNQFEAPVTVTGVLPAWLTGQVVRTAPAVFESGGWQAEHWFDGLGMLYAFTLGEGGRVTFRQRQLDSAVARAPATSGAFATTMKRGLLKRLLQPIPTLPDNTNVNVLPFGDDLVALTETSHQWVIDPVTLKNTHYLQWHDAMNALNTLAHPQYDPQRRRIVNVGTVFGKDSALTVIEHEPNGRVRREVGRWSARRIPYVHSFGLTPRHAVLVGHPLDVSPLSLLFSNKGYIHHFAWRPEQGTKLIVVDREGGGVRTHHAKPFFVFHTVNAFEDGDTTVLDVVAYDDASIISQLSTQAVSSALPDLRSKLVRVRMTRGRDEATVTPLSDARFEFPSIHYGRFNGQPYSTVWGASLWPEAGGLRSRLVKVDVGSGRETAFEDGDHLFGEPLFVGAPGAAREDDGVLLSVGSHRTERRAVLQVVDASSMQAVARAEVPLPLPLGFHGSFVRAKATSQA